ncbi:hypothetical protein HK101_004923 [Irineochytrium annulatum]|nr:hypothetical protein HK101_004923 [Irineochytrium annulatum]
MIIFNFVFSHLPTTVLTFGSNLIGTEQWVFGYATEEKIQMTLFWVQETILSLVYLKYTQDASKAIDKDKNKKILMHTVYINIFILLLDLAALVFEYINLYDYQIMFKALLYAIKIKCEFAVLQILMKVMGQKKGSESSATDSQQSSRVVQSKQSATVHREPAVANTKAYKPTATDEMEEV